MKIEKVNDNQIRCTLTWEDLANRHLKLSELAYGSEKARSLFHDMMQQANYEFGFETDDLPLMIEAVPLSSDTILLIITKVEYPDELDTRFSKFSEPDENEYPDYSSSQLTEFPTGANDILNLFEHLRKHAEEMSPQSNIRETPAAPAAFPPGNAVTAPPKPSDDAKIAAPVSDMIKLFVFRDLDQLTALAHVLNGYYNEDNSLYRDTRSNLLYLMIHKGHHSPEEFNKICNILSEYATVVKYTSAIGAYFDEHLRLLIAKQALQTLCQF